ncbi:DUF2637 domain-containing protein [Streptacidiphilus melanogenes]|uniref:DUF2637 domain-containing protein n=1 Tax=Streptacidiphilus melanogenes TaxID=411235 RepID=UPI0005AAB3BE|nr:DUF2637 domain-containing protein [Streptacidiphilus melanogenes]
MPNPHVTRVTVTAVMGLIAALAFTFSFGNVWALALRLGIPHPIAPLIAPMVDLSVVGLLAALRHLSLTGIDRRELRPAIRLMHTSGLLTLALNTAEPLILHHWGRAALDAVAPLLLLGWGAVGPLLLRHLHTPLTPLAPMTGPVGPETHSPSPVETSTALPHPTSPDPTPAPEPVTEPPAPEPNPAPAAPLPVPAGLLVTARQLDQQHRAQHGHPMTATQLGTRMGLPSPMANAVHAELITA